MKILYTNFHLGAGISGHTVYVMRLAEVLARRHRISIATPPGSALYRLACGLEGVSVHAQAFPNRAPRWLAARATLRALLEEGNFDIVHVNGSADHRLVMLACMGMKRRPRIVLTKHNDMRIAPMGAWMRARLATDSVIAVCDYVARQVSATPYQRLGVTTIHNGIDTDYFAPWPQDEARRLRARWLGAEDRGRLLVGSNAGTGSYKAWIDMLRAVALLPPGYRERVHVVVAGNPPEQVFIDEIARLGLEGQFSHAGNLDDVRPLVAALDVGFVLSYRVETISFACREMMAMGKPVIVSRHAGLPENIAEGDDGWIVPVRDPHAIAALLQEMLDGVHPLADMARRARAKAAREFGLTPFVEGTEKVYRDLLAHDGGRVPPVGHAR